MRIGHVAPLTGFLAFGGLTAGLTGVLADDLGRRLGEGLASAVAAVAPPAPPLPPRCELVPDQVSAAPVSLAALASPGRSRVAGGAPPSLRPVAHPAPAPRRGLRVPAEAVLRLARSGARPRGVPVPAEGERPAGILLQDVGGLGIGLEDGDVLTMAGGVPARSPSDVVGMVIAARGRRAVVIGGQFWRDGVPWDLVVEQPYPEPPGRQGRDVGQGTRAVDVGAGTATAAEARGGSRLTAAPVATK
ncbi:MAG TPA: hypothetical protein PLU22_25140 [Polyangiaceae bacterium]|nr:hypothetical protein [Polyangiaceae bacterium]